MSNQPREDHHSDPFDSRPEFSAPIRCTATTAAGNPCQAWAMRDSDPPLCAPHAGLVGAPKGNTNAVTHGYYRQRVQPEELNAVYDTAAKLDLAQEAILLRVLLRRLANFLNDPDLALENIKSITPLIVSTSRALGYLQQRMPDHPTIDWDAVLDRVGQELDWDL